MLNRFALVFVSALTLSGIGCQPAKTNQQVEREEQQVESDEVEKIKGLSPEKLGELLKNGTPIQRRAAMALIPEYANSGKLAPELMTALCEATKDQDAKVRRRALLAIQFQLRFGNRPANVLQIFCQAVKDSDPEVRYEGLNALSRLGAQDEATLTLILVAVKDPNSKVRSLAASSLGRYEKHADRNIVVLKEVLKDPDPLVRQEALWSLRQYGRKSVILEQELIFALQDPSERVRWEASITLSEIDGDPQKIVPAVLKAFEKETSATNREWFAKCLGRYPTAFRETVPVLVRYLSKDDSWPVRSACAESLGLIRADPKRSVPALLEAAKDEDGAVRGCAFVSLAAFGVEEAIPVIVAGLKDKKTRAPAGIAIGKFGPAANTAIPELIKMLRDEDDNNRRVAVLALIAIGPQAKEAIPLLHEIRKEGTIEAVLVENAVRRIDPNFGKKP